MATQTSSSFQAEWLPGKSRNHILSVVCVVTANTDFAGVLPQLHREVTTVAIPAELIVVINDDSQDALSSLRLLAEQYDCLQIYMLKRPVDQVTAILAGMENAIGDWVVSIDPESDDPTVIRRLLEPALRDNVDAVVGVPEHSSGPLFGTLLSSLFHRCFRAMNGFDLSSESASVRLLSRAMVNSLLNDKSPVVAFEILTARGKCRKCVIPCIRRRVTLRPLRERVIRRWRTLIGTNAAPLRLANLLSGIAAVCAVLYSLYVLVIYLLKKDVVPGWTTLSLMISGMFLMVALVLWLLSEYLVMLLDPRARQPQYEICDEFGGRMRRSDDVLNVETQL